MDKGKGKFRSRVILAMLLCCLCVGSVVSPAYVGGDIAKAAEEQSTVPDQKENQENKIPDGWKKESSGKKRYYKNGTYVTGLQQIGDKKYFFSKSGVMKTGTVKSGKTTYYLTDKGELEMSKTGTKYYLPGGKKLTKVQAGDFETLLTARKIAAKITKKSDSKSKKLKKCFKWVMDKHYKQYRNFRPVASWPATYANDHFKRGAGDCHSDGAAMAYFARAIGYTKAYVCNDSNGKKHEGHCWAEINGKVYDPLFAQAKSYRKNYGVSYKTYKLHPVLHIAVSSYLTTSVRKTAAAKSSSGKAGLAAAKTSSGTVVLKKVNGKYRCYQGKKSVKSKWMTISGKKYYFKKNGDAATLSVKIGKTYYVFNAKGQLQQPSATKVVTIGGKKYRVTSEGKAKAGWSKDGKKYYAANGEMLKGIQVSGGKFFAFTSKGNYDAARTKKLRSAAKYEKDISSLKKLIGKPKKTSYYDGCFTYKGKSGKDGEWKYSNFKVGTFRTNSGKEIFMWAEGKSGIGKIPENKAKSTAASAKPKTKAQKLKAKVNSVVGSKVRTSDDQNTKLKKLFVYTDSFQSKSVAETDCFDKWAKKKAYKGWEKDFAKDFAYEMFTKKSGSCYHYSAAYAYLAKKILGNGDTKNVRIAIGRTNGFSGKWQDHAWTEVKIGGTWYVCDPTLDVSKAKTKNNYGKYYFLKKKSDTNIGKVYNDYKNTKYVYVTL